MNKAISEATGLPIQTKASNEAYAEGWDRLFGNPVPIGEDQRPKDRVKLGISPSTIIQDMDCRRDK
jgi:predicted methyltransferase MtxX (methanogen marker protein 4)|tara:strand:+ start:260 stop:457 length:198 start_codon:yes stop_codon:yes gene_type:complete